MLESEASAIAFRDVSWEWKTTKESNKPDSLSVNFYANFPKASLGSDELV